MKIKVTDEDELNRCSIVNKLVSLDSKEFCAVVKAAVSTRRAKAKPFESGGSMSRIKSCVLDLLEECEGEDLEDVYGR